MNKSKLFWGITWRMMGLGIFGGGALGYFYVFLLLFVNVFTQSTPAILGLTSIAPFGCIVGGVFGFVLGLLDGLALGSITIFILPGSINPRTYRMIVYIATVLLTGSGAYYGFSGLSSSLDVVNSDWFLYRAIPTLIAAVAAWLAGIRVAGWVESSASMPATPE
jgi:hypothetical protein